MILFGGFTHGEKRNDLFMYKFKAKQWSKIDCLSDSPSPRAGMSLCVRDEAIILFGGKNDRNKRLNDTWLLDSEACKWTLSHEVQQPNVYSQLV